MRQGGSDAQSSDTTFTGLPKACKLWCSASQPAPVAGTPTALVFDRSAFNYGGFAQSGAFPNCLGAIVPEPGVYETKGQVAIAAGSQLITLMIYVNGAATAPDGTQAAFSPGVPSNTANPIFQVSAPLELKQGDVVGLYWLQTAVAQASFGTYTWLYVEKKGGQY